MNCFDKNISKLWRWHSYISDEIVKENYHTTQGEIKQLRTDQSQLKTDFHSVQSELKQLHTDYSQLQTAFNAVQDECKKLRTAHIQLQAEKRESQQGKKDEVWFD